MWNEYWKNAIDEIDETERRTERTWRYALAAIVAWELWFRRRIRRGAIMLPSTIGGAFDTTFRREFQAFRRQVRDDAIHIAERLGIELGGRRDAFSLVTTRPEERGIVNRAMEEVAEAFRPNWERLEALRRRFEATVARPLPPRPRRPGPDGKGPSGPGAPPPSPAPPSPNTPPRGVTPEQLAEIERELALFARKKRRKKKKGDEDPPDVEEKVAPKKREDDDPFGIGELPPPRKAEDDPFGVDDGLGPKKREAEDLFEIETDALINIARNLGYHLDRVTETTLRLSGRFGTPSGIDDFLDGGGSGRPWEMNRNDLRLSTTAHLRALHRRRTITEGIASGIAHYRLDVPTERLGMVTPTSLTGAHAWQVKPLSEWREIADRYNRPRVQASSFDTLGFGFGDMTYVVPVPAVFLNAAVEQGRKWRGRLAAGLIGAAVAKATERRRVA